MTMNAPDKIYLSPSMIILAKRVTLDEVEYIRKDSILKWAKQKQYESTTIVADNFWQEVIDKINTL